MDLQIICPKQTPCPPEWEVLLSESGLHPEGIPDMTVLLYDRGRLAATGSRDGMLIKYLAVDPAFRGQDLTARILTAIRKEYAGRGSLFLCTKPVNVSRFQAFFFYPVARTKRVVMMEDRKDGLQRFLSSLPAGTDRGRTGAVVMNCDPFTKGHLHLIETACADCDRLYVFILSEDRGTFCTADRLLLAKEGTAHLSNVTVLPSGPYMISSATFPTYFLPDRDHAAEVRGELDAEIFAGQIAPALHIRTRYVGSEPFSALTGTYNATLKRILPDRGVAVTEVPRFCVSGVPVSASAVRSLYAAGDLAAIRPLVPETTYAFLDSKYKEDLLCREPH